MNDFKNFKVYKDSQKLIVIIFRLTRKFSGDFYYLTDQMNRCALSIVLNIAEGSGKRSDKDFNRYIKNALGSASELSAALDVVYNLGLISKDEFEKLISEVDQIIKQLGGFSKFLSKVRD